MEAWTDIVMIDCGYNATIALDADGGVHIAGDTAYGQAALDGADGAVSIAAGGNFCLVVFRDGSVQMGIRDREALRAALDGAFKGPR